MYSLPIANCRLPIFAKAVTYFFKSAIGNWQSAIT